MANSWMRVGAVGSMVLAAAVLIGVANATPYIRDDVNDVGAEPNNTASVLYLSPDIFVRNDPLPGWTPYPYPIAGQPAWLTSIPPSQLHQDPDYRSPRSGRPNYVYVRIRNNGVATAGGEHLFVYWASASSGLTWDPNKLAGSFVDNVQNNVLLGQEITKPRKDAASASVAERAAYVQAILDIAASPYIFPGGTDYWRTQEAIHRFGPSTRHHTPAFLPWHREFINRYEGLLQEANPKVKLLYWNWTQSPRLPPLDYFTSAFMGASGYQTASGVTIGPPFQPATDGAYSNFFHNSNAAERRLANGSPPVESDATVLGRTDYYSSTPATSFSDQMELHSHDTAHPYIGGVWAGQTDAGDMSVPETATRDPFFFLLHTKVDELWARWQRQSLTHLDPATTFGNNVSPASLLTSPIQPWAGIAYDDSHTPHLPAFPNNNIAPWNAAGGEQFSKPANDRSVTSPPIYDSALLTLPAMPQNSEVIMEIPWYPPDPSTVGTALDPGHACLVARIETSSTYPYGMSTPETTDLGFNTSQNNRIAWRNVHIVDSFPGPFKLVHFILRNVADEAVATGLRLGAVLNDAKGDFTKTGTVRIDLGPELFKRWRAANRGDVPGVEILPDGILRMTAARVTLKGLALRPREEFPVRLTFDLNRDYRPTAKDQPIPFDVVQVGMPGKPDAVVGGNRYNIDTEKLVLVRQGETWRWISGGKPLPLDWDTAGFDDRAWYGRRLELGLQGLVGGGSPTTYFRRLFDVDDPSFVRSLAMRLERGDGAVVYLNGKEIYRSNLPDGRVESTTFARVPLTDIERKAFFLVPLDRGLLRQGRNVVAAEIHRAERGLPDPAFDLELDANWQAPQEAPYAAFANIVDGTLAHIGKPFPIDVEALSTTGDIRQVTLSVDGRVEQTLEKPPFRFIWTARGGPHRMVATVVDGRGLQSEIFATVTGVKNLPPNVEIVQPAHHIVINKGDTVDVVVQASDPDGQIAGVDFFVDDRFLFSDPERFIGTDTTAPYTVTLRDLKVGDNMIMAIARDNDGARSVAIPAMVIVQDGKGPPRGAEHRMH